EDERIRALTEQALLGRGYKVLCAGDGREALGVAHANEGRIDLLVTDVVMPSMGGAELAARLTAAVAGLRVLYLSGHTEDAMLRHGVREEQVAFLQKPFTLSDLARKVREVLDGVPPITE